MYESDKPYAKFNEEVIKATIQRYSGDIVKNINAGAVIRDMLKNMPEPPKLTRWQRFKRDMKAMPSRIKDAWKVLTGRAYIEDEY